MYKLSEIYNGKTIAEKIEQKANSAYAIPGSSNQQILYRVILCDPELDYKAGDIILVEPCGCHREITLDGKQLIVIAEEKVIGKVEEVNE